jgi:hypothetical protein
MSPYLNTVYQVSEAMPRLPRTTFPLGHGAMQGAYQLRRLYHDHAFAALALPSGGKSHLRCLGICADVCRPCLPL